MKKVTIFVGSPRGRHTQATVTEFAADLLALGVAVRAGEPPIRQVAARTQIPATVESLATAMIKGWNIDLAALYGDLPRQSTREELFESPDGQYAVVLYGIDEVGVMKEAGRVAVFRNRAAPELVFRPDDAVFWYAGPQTVEFDPTGRFASLHEFRPQRWHGGWPAPNKRIIDLAPDAI